MTAFTKKHKEVLRHCAKSHYHCAFPTLPARNEGQLVVSNCSWDMNWWPLTQGSPILFIRRRDVSRLPSGSEFATQRKMLLKERRVWLIVLFLSGSPCSLESPWTKQPERKCTECNEAEASFLCFSLSLSLFVNATAAQTDILFLPLTKASCQLQSDLHAKTSLACLFHTKFMLQCGRHHSLDSLFLLQSSPAPIITCMYFDEQ